MRLESLNSIDTNTILRYDTRAPRYTSYPTAPHFTDAFTLGDYRNELAAMTPGQHPVSLYIHVPFCPARCTFCGCNVIIARKRYILDDYLDWIEKEADMVLGAIPSTSRPVIGQFHIGGGTPNYLSDDQLERLVKIVHDRFECLPDAEFALELDPRRVTSTQADSLRGLGFNRVSIGVQDTNIEVQEAIGRVQPLDDILDAVGYLRNAGFSSLNVDLIYGLPRQTRPRWEKTLADMARINPDRVAMYAFAYLPSKLKNQGAIDPADILIGADRLELFLAGLKYFTANGYRYIGIDHFARHADELAVALNDRTLKRNFMGYSTRAGMNVIALGPSGISNLQTCFAQNEKHLAAYARHVFEGTFPIERGMKLNADDRIRAQVIQDLMCFGSVRKPDIADAFHIDFDTYFHKELERLAPLQRDGLVTLASDTISTTLTGQVLLRIVASQFDAYLNENGHGTSQTYSRTV